MPLFATVFKKSTQPQCYKTLAHLTTYSGSIHALAISNDGCILAGGVWATTRQTTAAVETLCYGTGLGYITFLRHGLIDNNFQEICARRLGSVGIRDKVVQVLMLNTSTQLQSIFAVQLENTVPKSVAFADNRVIYVFRLYDGKFMKLEEEDGTIVEEISCKSMIHTAVHQKHGIFIVDNATDGFTLYCLEGKGEPLRTFVTALPRVKMGQVLETLHHADAGLVQTIAAHDLDGRCTIACALPSGREKTTIKIWVHDYVVQKVSKTPPQN
ncbi:uncharacterized protein EDB93DRAFT_1109658 [Suillus bovinus]|uniref:uncharacterized protein n=1 Tax=Suillus bovinus TaxID=48563 RepID=UPI001B87BC28|nr:uncharacterized protein EDB93DRAFT_1109658 [Suillus bovinus]KAG2126384.1 hypothetical protein EDB93DRAFT_1109658 [Suillus bovinus]